jgi:Zn-finger nucleic acid-binding protein
MYRDEYERCPRCHVELIDAGAVRACTACQGQFATLEILQEMAAQMTHPRPARLFLTSDAKRARIACPACTDAMDALRLGHIEIDRCTKHGLWFDRNELQQVLLAVYELDQRTPQ